MTYDKAFFDESGEEFPYSEEIDQNGYTYRISVCLDGRDGELLISNKGSYLFFDEGDFIDFNICPQSFHPNKAMLEPSELLGLMAHIYENQENSKKYSNEDRLGIYEKYLLARERKI